MHVGRKPTLRVLAEVQRPAADLLRAVDSEIEAPRPDVAALDRELCDSLDLVVLAVGEVACRPRLPVGGGDDERNDQADTGHGEARDLLVHPSPLVCSFARFETSRSSASRMKLATTLEPP